MIFKIGQKIQSQSNCKISLSSNKKVLIKKGDIAQIVRKLDNDTAEIIYLTGEAKGQTQHIKIQVTDSLDVDLIAKKILNEIQK
ncbi:hypothetical protein CLOACE_02510 [Clostridium acetireducens DSM 10703]|jgi:hypothetical protein|uniref:Uncharacterized protein n=1 Tax=Clostridium acetireducens DSM 10703 TaxID=1121290 RepID=A0A1E8F1C2_9CLOT|nr:hypothetical protein [Clostridium acetireducens]OFI07423.1 hypothetical protein CLOACE_02510 [Clostridium acetireducens DSM 10703]